MTKQHWLTCADPMKMLGSNVVHLSKRKLQLFESGVYWIEKDDSDPSLLTRAHILRDVFGMMEDGMQLDWEDESWLTDTVVKLAQSIYDERTFERMLILADAIEEAGCTNETILGHCRSPLPHVRGCWVLDSILGLE